MRFDRVAITGGSGRLGAFVTGELSRHCDVTVLDLETPWTIDDRFLSNSRNCPFVGREVRGRAVSTVVEGRVVFQL